MYKDTELGKKKGAWALLYRFQSHNPLERGMRLPTNYDYTRDELKTIRLGKFGVIDKTPADLMGRGKRFLNKFSSDFFFERKKKTCTSVVGKEKKILSTTTTTTVFGGLAFDVATRPLSERAVLL